MGGIRTAGDLVAWMQMTRKMRINEAKAYVADKLGVDVIALTDEEIMRQVREDLDIGIITSVSGSAKIVDLERPPFDGRIIKRVNKSQISIAHQLRGMQIGIVIRVTFQNDFAAKSPYSIDLDPRRRYRHDDHSSHAALARRQCYALSVIPGRAANDAVRELGITKTGDLVVRTAQLEREYRLQIFSFHPDAIAEPRRECFCEIQRRFHSHVIDAGVLDQLKVVGIVHCAVIAHRGGIRKGSVGNQFYSYDHRQR